MSDEQSNDRKFFERYWFALSVAIGLILAACFVLVFTLIPTGPTTRINGDTAATVTAIETRSIALWTKWTAISQIFGGLVTLAAATFAALAYREAQYSRKAAVRQAEAAEDQVSIERDRSRRAGFNEIQAKMVRDANARRERARLQTEQDERAAASRAILVIDQTIFNRSSDGGPIFGCDITLLNVGGSAAIDPTVEMTVMFVPEAGAEQRSVAASRTIRALASGNASRFRVNTAGTPVEPPMPDDLALKVINDAIRLQLKFVISWRDVHGYLVLQKFEHQRIFTQNEWEALIEPRLIREAITIGNRMASERATA